MKQKLKENWKTIAMAVGIIAVTAIIITVALAHKKGDTSGKYGAGVTLCEYENIPLTLEKAEITDEDIKETAQWSIDYYNQSLTAETGEDGDSDKDKKSKKESKVETLSLDTLTDEQVKTAFGAETVDEFYDNIKKQKEESDEKTRRSAAYEQICNYLIENCKIENFPEDKAKERLDKYIADTKKQCEESYDMTFAEYCESTGMTEDEYTESLSDHVKRSINLEIIFTAIGDKEDIQYEESAFDEYLESLISNGGYESKDDVYEQYGEDYLKTAYRVEFITDWLIEKADITYTNPEDEIIESEPAQVPEAEELEEIPEEEHDHDHDHEAE